MSKIWQFQPHSLRLLGWQKIIGLLTVVSVLGIVAAKVPVAIAQYTQPTIPPAYPSPVVSPLNGTWKLQWQRKRYFMQGTLTLVGNSGIMTVNVRYPEGQIDVIQQQMLLQPSGNGFILSGQNPVYAGTNMPITTYNPDIFFIQQSRNLEGWNVKNCDITRGCSSVRIDYVGPASP